MNQWIYLESGVVYMLREEVEVCPNCMGENIIQWDVEKDGYKVKCQHCGEEMMLCDACLHSEDNEDRFCDWSESGCWRDRMVNIIIYKDTAILGHEDDNNLIIIKLFEWCVRKYVDENCKENYDKWIESYTADDTEGLFNFVITNDYKYELEEYQSTKGD